jgi:hypothetical protein
MTEARRRHETQVTRGGAWLTRGGPVCLTLLLASLALVSVASAAPTATFKTRPLPIPGFPGTGDILAAGVEVEVQATISGTEYGGFPSPLTELDIYAPAGLKVTPMGFPACSLSLLQTGECPKKSSAGPQGTGLGFVSFGGERVPEEVTIKSFFALGGGLTFVVNGNTPASFEVLEPGHWTVAAAPYGPEMVVLVPLIETVPGANDASVTSFKVRIGAAYRKGRRTISYLTQPKRCPKGGFPTKMELKFLSGESVTVSDTVPCPPHPAGAN